jgi:aminopeptidase N
LGDELWWSCIKHYVKSNAGKQVSTYDFQSAIEKISGRDYQWFFDQWIYKVGTPIFEISKMYDQYKNELSLIIKQNQEQINSTNFQQTHYFKGIIDIYIENKIYPIELKSQKENIYKIKHNTAPKFVHFNVNENFLCEYVFKQNTDEYLHQLEFADDIAAKKVAIDALISVSKDSTTTTELRDQIQAAFNNQINSKFYWRYRLYALTGLNRIQGSSLNEEYKKLLINLINTEAGWIKSTAILNLSTTKDPQYLPIYKEALLDKSDRVINAAAIAIGKTKSLEAYELLMNLENKKSWKNQNRISALVGLEQLGDQRAVNYVLDCIKDNLSPRWYLATAIWDYPYAAVNTLLALGKAELAYPILVERFKASLNDGDLNDIFQNVQLIDLLKDKRAIEIYSSLKKHFEHDQKMAEVIALYEKNYLESIK